MSSTVPFCTSSNHHKLKDYIAEVEAARITYFSGFMNDEYDIHIFDIFDNYWNNEENMTTIQFDNREKMKYRYNPMQLCKDLYGTFNFAEKIMEINECDAPGNFSLDKEIIVPTATSFFTYLEKVYNFRRNELGNSFQDF